ncbi:MAG: DUF898 domain-containing protein [Burkholderiales bacterium]|nr:DUF898 domain-containing protein [Burkholderiales bacterium]
MEPLSAPQQLTRADFEFTGSGGEYFRIWIVNIALTVLTLGVYSAWAKVRRLQYFYRNTRVADASFDYHGRPLAILKGRVVAVALLFLYNLALEFQSLLALVIAVPVVPVLPWLLRQSLRFRLHYSSWRGLRFAFHGGTAGAYRVFMLWPILSFASFYLLGPMWHQRLKRYQHGNAAFGATPFAISAGVGAFYRPYLVALGGLILLTVVALPAALALTAGVRAGYARQFMTAFGVLGVLGAGFMVLIGPYLMSRIQNLVWNTTTLGPHRFRCRLRARSLAWIGGTNLLLIVLTLGLYLPFAAVRLARYRASCTSLLPGSALDEFVASEKAGVAALGEELGELLDIDISL